MGAARGRGAIDGVQGSKADRMAAGACREGFIGNAAAALAIPPPMRPRGAGAGAAAAATCQPLFPPTERRILNPSSIKYLYGMYHDSSRKDDAPLCDWLPCRPGLAQIWRRRSA